jgi:hypothetical protein
MLAASTQTDLLACSRNPNEPAEHKKFVAAEIQKIKAAVDASGKYAD